MFVMVELVCISHQHHLCSAFNYSEAHTFRHLFLVQVTNSAPGHLVHLTTPTSANIFNGPYGSGP